MDLLASHGIPSNLSVEDYRQSLPKLRALW
jgi:hypothetical protein